MKPVLSAVAEHFGPRGASDMQATVRVAAFDADAEAPPRDFPVNALPTFYLSVAGPGHEAPLRYNGGPSVEAMVRFVEEQAEGWLHEDEDGSED